MQRKGGCVNISIRYISPHLSSAYGCVLTQAAWCHASVTAAGKCFCRPHDLQRRGGCGRGLTVPNQTIQTQQRQKAHCTAAMAVVPLSTATAMTRPFPDTASPPGMNAASFSKEGLFHALGQSASTSPSAPALKLTRHCLTRPSPPQLNSNA